MANDRRFLYEGNPEKAIGQVFVVGPTPTRITVSGLAARQCVRLQQLVGPNWREADETQWSDLTSPTGAPMNLTDAKPYLLVVQPGTMRVHPDDILTLSSDARIWCEDATYLGQDRIRYNVSADGPTPLQNPATEDGVLTDITALNLAAGNTGPKVSVPDGSYYRITIANDSAAAYALYGYSTDAQLKLSKCEKLIVSPEEMDKLVFTAPTGGTKLIVETYAMDCA